MDPVTWLTLALVVLTGWYIVDLGRRQLRTVEETVADLLDADEVDQPDPPRGAPLVEEAVSAGFVRVTSLRQPIADTVLITTLCVSSDGVLLDVTWSEDDGTPPPAFAYGSVLDGGRAILTTQSLGHLPTTDGELRQVFPDDDPATLLAHHREALAWLAAKGLEPQPTAPETAVREFRRWTERSGQAAAEARWPAGIGIWWRQTRGRHLDRGPLAQQDDIGERLEALGAGAAPGESPV